MSRLSLSNEQVAEVSLELLKLVEVRASSLLIDQLKEFIAGNGDFGVYAEYTELVETENGRTGVKTSSVEDKEVFVVQLEQVSNKAKTDDGLEYIEYLKSGRNWGERKEAMPGYTRAKDVFALYGDKEVKKFLGRICDQVGHSKAGFTVESVVRYLAKGGKFNMAFYLNQSGLLKGKLSKKELISSIAWQIDDVERQIANLETQLKILGAKKKMRKSDIELKEKLESDLAEKTATRDRLSSNLAAARELKQF